jgi:hypothetical protein
VTREDFIAALDRIGWKPLGENGGPPYRHEATKTTSYGPDGHRHEQMIDYLFEVAEHRERVQRETGGAK